MTMNRESDRAVHAAAQAVAKARWPKGSAPQAGRVVCRAFATLEFKPHATDGKRWCTVGYEWSRPGAHFISGRVYRCVVGRGKSWDLAFAAADRREHGAARVVRRPLPVAAPSRAAALELEGAARRAVAAWLVGPLYSSVEFSGAMADVRRILERITAERGE